MPIVVSALKPSGPAARSGEVHVGDTILSVNGMSLQQVRTDAEYGDLICVGLD